MLKEKFNIDAQIISLDDGEDSTRFEDYTKFKLRGNWQIKEAQLARASIDD
jgi:hypothetical protein